MTLNRVPWANTAGPCWLSILITPVCTGHLKLLGWPHFIFQHLVCETPLGSRKNTTVKIIGSPTSENMILDYLGAVEELQHVSELRFETFENAVYQRWGTRQTVIVNFDCTLESERSAHWRSLQKTDVWVPQPRFWCDWYSLSHLHTSLGESKVQPGSRTTVARSSFPSLLQRCLLLPSLKQFSLQLLVSSEFTFSRLLGYNEDFIPLSNRGWLRQACSLPRSTIS